MKHVSNAFRCTQLCLIYDCARTYDEAEPYGNIRIKSSLHIQPSATTG